MINIGYSREQDSSTAQLSTIGSQTTSIAKGTSSYTSQAATTGSNTGTSNITQTTTPSSSESLLIKNKSEYTVNILYICILKYMLLLLLGIGSIIIIVVMVYLIQ